MDFRKPHLLYNAAGRTEVFFRFTGKSNDDICREGRMVQFVLQHLATVDEHANTSSASIPLALDVAVRDGRIQPGDLLLFEAFGAGFTWGSALVRY